MNEVSIIINGVRYDAVDIPNAVSKCWHCDVVPNVFCCSIGKYNLCDTFKVGSNKCFKKSDKKFES